MKYLKKVIEDFNFCKLLNDILFDFNRKDGIDSFLDTIIQYNPGVKELLSREFNNLLSLYIPELDSHLNLGIIMDKKSYDWGDRDDIIHFYHYHLIRSEERILRNLESFCNLVKNHYPEEHRLIWLFNKIYSVACLFYTNIRACEFDNGCRRWDIEKFIPDPKLLEYYPEVIDDLKKLSKIYRVIEVNSIIDTGTLYSHRLFDFHSGFDYRWSGIVSFSDEDIDDFKKINQDTFLINPGKETETIKMMIYDLKEINERLSSICRVSNRNDCPIDKATLQNLHQVWEIFFSIDNGILQKLYHGLRCF